MHWSVCICVYRALNSICFVASLLEILSACKTIHVWEGIWWEGEVAQSLFFAPVANYCWCLLLKQVGWWKNTAPFSNVHK